MNFTNKGRQTIMKPVKGQNQTNKMEGDEQMITSSEKPDSKEINPTQPQGLTDEESKQMKEQSKRMRRPKSGKSL